MELAAVSVDTLSSLIAPAEAACFSDLALRRWHLPGESDHRVVAEALSHAARSAGGTIVGAVYALG